MGVLKKAALGTVPGGLRAVGASGVGTQTWVGRMLAQIHAQAWSCTPVPRHVHGSGHRQPSCSRSALLLQGWPQPAVVLLLHTIGECH